MEHENFNKPSLDYKEIVCSIYCDILLQKNQSILNEYFDFCSARLVLSAVDFEKKQMYLSGSIISILEAGKRRLFGNFLSIWFCYQIEKRFLELQNKLLIENTKEQIAEGVHWWYEAWDATWQLYNSKIITEIEYHYKSNIFNVIIRLMIKCNERILFR
jgi:hypothetical protein